MGRGVTCDLRTALTPAYDGFRSYNISKAMIVRRAFSRSDSAFRLGLRTDYAAPIRSEFTIHTTSRSVYGRT